MAKPSKTEMAKYRSVLEQQLRTLGGDVGAMREEALRASEQDNSVDHLADQGTDNADQAFTLGLIENEEETMTAIQDALERMSSDAKVPYGACMKCFGEVQEKQRKRSPSAGSRSMWPSACRKRKNPRIAASARTTEASA